MFANIAKNLFWNEKEQLTLITGKRSGGKATTAERFLWLKLPLGIQNDKLLHQNKNKNAAWRIIKKESIKLNVSMIVERLER